MKELTFTLLIALFLGISASLAIAAEEAIDQEKILDRLREIEQQSPKTAQPQVQKPSQSQQQQTQQRVQKPTPRPQQQTQQQVQKPSQGQQQQTQQQVQKPSQSQQQQTQQQVQKPTYVKVGPRWKIGTTWRVETTNLQKQGPAQRQSKPVVWVFTVVAETKIGNRTCFEVTIRCQDDAGRQPRISIWVDKVSGMLLRVSSQMLVRGQWRTFTETYTVPEGKSVAVFGSIPSLPLDMPLFITDAGSKYLDGMTYEVVTGARGAKSLGEVGFTHKIDQVIKPISEEKSKELANAKSLGETISLVDAVEVELHNGPTKRIRQLWVPDCPWPVYSTNGISESRLLDVTVPQ